MTTETENVTETGVETPAADAGAETTEGGEAETVEGAENTEETVTEETETANEAA